MPASTSKGLHPLRGSERRPAEGARAVGPADPKEQMSVTVVVRRRPGGPMLPTPAPGAALSREEFKTQFGATDHDLKEVADFAQRNHLTVEETNVSGRTVKLTGTVAAMDKAFGVDLQRYETGDNGSYRGRDGFVHVPENLLDVIEGVFGLDNRPIGGRNSTIVDRRPISLEDDIDFANIGDPPNTGVLTVPQVAGLYNFPTTSAAGQTIGILEMGGGYKPADIKKFFTSQSLTTPTLTDVGIDGATNSPGTSADQEVVLDICVAGAVAQGADVAVYFADGTQKGWVDAITKAVHPQAGDP